MKAVIEIDFTVKENWVMSKDQIMNALQKGLVEPSGMGGQLFTQRTTQGDITIVIEDLRVVEIRLPK
jgi:hypothetical protein